jgi:hypothetical protein
MKTTDDEARTMVDLRFDSRERAKSRSRGSGGA